MERQLSDLLMYVASFAMDPAAPVLRARSEPAKSTIFSFDFWVLPSIHHTSLACQSMHNAGYPTICCHLDPQSQNRMRTR